MLSVFERIEQLLRGARVSFEMMRHAPVYTSEEAAAIRGTALTSGAKALIMKIGEHFEMLVMPADRKVDSKKVRAAFGVKSLRFATHQEVMELTGLQPGSIPPFGSLFGLATTCDPALAVNAAINFNAGDHAVSIKMACSDYFAIEKPRRVEVT